MSIRATDPENVALYDSVTMAPLPGLLFDSIEHADDFVAYCGQREVKLSGKAAGAPTSQAHLAQRFNVAMAYEAWTVERCDGDGNLKPDDPNEKASTA